VPNREAKRTMELKVLDGRTMSLSRMPVALATSRGRIIHGDSKQFCAKALRKADNRKSEAFS
jgi:hypothetical protein